MYCVIGVRPHDIVAHLAEEELLWSGPALVLTPPLKVESCFSIPVP